MKHCRPYKRNINLKIHRFTMFSQLPGVKLGECGLRWLAEDRLPNTHRASLEVKDCWPVRRCTGCMHHFYTPQSSDISYVLSLCPSDKKSAENLLPTGFTHELAPLSRPHHRSSSPIRPEAFGSAEALLFELLRASSSFIDKHSYNPASHWAVQRPQKTKSEAQGRLKLFRKSTFGNKFAFVKTRQNMG